MLITDQFVLINFPKTGTRFLRSTLKKIHAQRGNALNRLIGRLPGIREVATLVDGHKNSGTYKVTFDASVLSSGTYFYQLKSGEFSEMKKMVLIK